MPEKPHCGTIPSHPGSGSPILEIRNVHKRFGALRALNGVTFGVERGTIHGVAGPNGAGKSTLFQVISGVPYNCDEGEILLDGRPIHSLPGSVVCRRGVARTFQKEAAFDGLSVQQNLVVAGAYGGRRLARSGLATAVDNVLNVIGLKGQAGRRAGELSLFDRKKLMLGTALVTDPQILLLDEPVAGLNHMEIDSFRKLVMDVRDGGVTVLIIEHVLPFLFGIASRITILDAGVCLEEGTPDQIRRSPRVHEAYLGVTANG